ncbi:hypothetical protein KGQ19_20040 [Catenulispora sp. NL8]|uniref:Uncharacterized protein n=1 Tax=Catenulispora pinistramenti TaxID=2705254 RepID=A0ABS5KSY6_9ACTN|nr:hypothetical protein [Catenulispora pinistramenti]MBS2549161.1 hypothetical protein [Catenulispora pinistramenti]
MTPARAVQAVAKSALWLAKYAVWGLSIVGLAGQGRPYRRPDDPAPVRDLTPDELLWQDELE